MRGSDIGAVAESTLPFRLKARYTTIKIEAAVDSRDHYVYTMSTSSGVIALKPMKGSELMQQHADSPPTESASRYVPPSKRGEEAKAPKPITAEQLESQASFPSLPSTGAMTKPVSWGKLRARLSSAPTTPRPDEPPPVEHSMKVAIEESLKRNLAAEEEAQRNEAITDPFLMSREKARREGWELLKLNMKGEEKRQWFSKSSYGIDEELEVPYVWPAPIMSFSVDRVQKLIQPVQKSMDQNR
jgi:hypothetical protein